MKLNIHCTCGNFKSGQPFTKDQCAVCWGRNNYQQRKKPTLAQQAANLATDAAAFVVAGAPITRKELRTQRLAICETCPEKIGSKCNLCGCVIRIAVWAATKNCPLGKWPTAEPAQSCTPPSQPQADP